MGVGGSVPPCEADMLQEAGRYGDRPIQGVGHLLENNSLMSLSLMICDTAWGWLQVVYPEQDRGRDMTVV